MKKLTLLFLALILCAISARAQWAAGISLGCNYNNPVINKGYAYDVSYRGLVGFNIDAIGRYSFTDWLAVRADLRLDSRKYAMERNYGIVQGVYTDHRDIYLHLPVVADFSFGGKKVRGHAYLGGYAGYWLSAYREGNTIHQTTEQNEIAVPFSEKMEFDIRRDQRFNAGLTSGIGISCLVGRKWEIFADMFYMYDLTSSNTVYMVAIPRYNNTLSVNFGTMFNF